MTWNDEELMAHADGELAGERRDALEQAMKHDARLRERVGALALQRQRVAAAFGEVLEEPVPDRLAALLGGAAGDTSASKVVRLDERRQQRGERRGMSSWAAWGGMAASLALGVVLGVQLLGAGRGGQGELLLGDTGGRLVAGERLARALDVQTGGDPAVAGGIAVQLSFVDKAGQYCRTFSAGATAGLACRQADRWTVDTTIATTTTVEQATSNGMRQASTPLPRAVLEAVDARIEGTALTAEQEKAARERAWRR